MPQIEIAALQARFPGNLQRCNRQRCDRG
jgi:hypothetical protein